MKTTAMMIRSAILATLCMMTTTTAWAANGVWNGTVNGFWTSSANWSAAPYPSGTDTASFTNAGNGQTLIDLEGLSSIKFITYDSPAVGAYTNGTGAANRQTLVLADSGIITLTDTAANSQVFNAGLQLGTTTAAGTYTITNANTAQELVFNSVFGALSGGTAAAKTLVVNGAGNTTILGNISRGGASNLTLTDNSSGTLTLSGSNTVLTLNMNGGSNSVVDIGSGYLSLENTGGTILSSSQGGTINGTGTIRLSTAGGVNYGDVKPAAGKTLVINPSIISTGAGLELNDAGTLVLNGINTWDWDVYFTAAGTISVSKIGNQGSTDSNLGKGKRIMQSVDNGKLVYTGTGETTDRILELSKNFTLDQSGTGTLIFSWPFNVLANTKTLTLQGSTEGVGQISGGIGAGTGTTSLSKAGTGTWILSGANAYAGTLTVSGGKLIFSGLNSYAGATTISGGILLLTGTNGAVTGTSGFTINGGATLLLENTSTANNTNRLRDAATIALNGGTLSITNNGGSVNYRENAGSLTIAPGGTSTIMTVEATAGQSNVLTFTALSYAGGKLNFVGNGLGASDQNRIFINGVTNGLMGAWATVNGTSYAAYSSTLGVYAATPEATFTDIAAEGGLAESVIPNNGALWARINLPGVSGPITLAGAVTNNIGYLSQNTTTNTTVAMVDSTTNKLLKAGGLSIAEGKASLTIGESVNDGSLSALTAGGTLVLDNNSTESLLTVNAPVVNNTSASALSKIGTGIAVLKGTNTYSGNTYLTAGILDYNVSTLTQTVSAVVSGAGSLMKSGAGTLNLNAANTFAGGLKINEGTVVTAQTSGLGAGPVTNNGILNLTGGALTYTGLSTSLAGSGTNNVTLSSDKTGTTTLNGNYSGFTGVWNIGIGGITSLTSRAQMTGTAQGVDNSAATINVLSNATLWAFTAGIHNAALFLNGGDQGEPYGQLRIDTAEWAGPITLAGPITQVSDGFIGSMNQDGIISGPIGEIGASYELSKVGNNKTTLTGSNTFTGPVWVKAGTVGVPAMGSIGSVGSPLGAQTTADQGRIKLGNTTAAGALSYTGAGETTDRMIDLAGTTGGGTLDQSGTGPLVLNGGMMISGTGNKTLTLQGSTAGAGEFSGILSNGVGSTVSVTKAGTGTWTLSGDNTYAGSTTLNSGKLIVAHPNALGTNLLVLITGSAALDYASDVSAGLYNYGFWFSSGFTSTISSSRTTPGAAVDRTLGYTGIGNSSLIFTNGANVTSGIPTFTMGLLNISAGGGGTATLVPITANLSISNITIVTSSVAKTLQLDGTSSGNTVGVISNGLNTLSITKANSSTWTLTGVCTYTGATTVNGGTLLVNATGSLGASSAVTVNNGGILGGDGTINGAVTANVGGKLAPGGIGTVATFNLSSNLTLNSTTLALDISNVATDKVAVAGAVTINNANIVDLTIAGGSLAEGTYTLMTYASKSGSGTFTLAHAYPNATLTAGDTSLTLTVGAGGTGYGLTWTGSDSANWDATDPILNWVIDGVETNFAAGDGVTFDDTASSFTVASGSAVNPGYVVFNNATDYTVSAAIDGTSPFVKLGTGITALIGLSTYNPTSVVVNAGTLTIGGTSQLNSGLYAGAIFNDSLLNYASASTQTNSGTIAGIGALLQSGSGTLVLSGSNTFSGTVTVAGGSKLTLLNKFALGTTAAGTTVASDGTLELAGDVATLGEALSLSGTLMSQTGSNTYAGAVTVQTGASFDVGTGSYLILSASIAGTAPFTKVGGGTLRFTIDPNNSGTMTINEGVAEITSGTTDGDIVINSGGTFMGAGNAVNDAKSITVNDGGVYDFRGADTISALNGSGLMTKGTAGLSSFTAGNGSGSFSGVVENGVGIIAFYKNGTGTQILSGVNTYTGVTTVTSGTLLVNSPGSLATNSMVTVPNSSTFGGSGTIYGPATFASGAILLAGEPNVISALTFGNNSATSLTLNGATLRYDLSNQVSVCDQVIIAGESGNLVLNGKNIIQLNFLGGSAPEGDYTLMTFNTYTGSGSFSLASAYPNATLELTTSNLLLHVTGGSTSGGLTWTGILSGVWDSGILNWTDGTSPAAYTAGKIVTFDDTAWGTLTVSSSGAVTPASMYFNNSVNAYTISANVSGTGPLVKQGSAALTLSGLSTYNPAFIELSSSTVTLSSASKLNNGSYAGNINNNGTLTYTSTSAQTLSGILSGPGALIKDSNSTMILSGTNTYAGATTVRGGGTLKILNNTALGATAGNTTVTNATLELAGDISVPAEALNLYGTLSSQTGSNTYAGVVTLRTNSFVDVGSGSILILTASTPDAGTAASFTKTGNGILRLTADPNHKGVCTVAGGTLEIRNTSGTTDADFIINAGATLMETFNALGTYRMTDNGTFDLRISDDFGGLDGSGVVTIGNTGAYTVTVGGGNQSGTFSGVMQNGTGTLGFTKAGTGTQTLSGIHTFSGNMSIAGTLILTGAGQFGSGYYVGTIANTGMFVHDSSATQTLSGVISGTAGVLRKTGAGKLILSAVNTYTGSTSISNGVLVGVTGGSCTSSAVFTNAAAAGKSATLGVLVTDNTKQWICSNLVVTNAGVSTGLEFDFGTVVPSASLAPLKVTNAVTFATTPNVTVRGGNITGVPGTVYPLMTWTSTSGTAPTAVTVLSARTITAHLTVSGTTLNLVIDTNSGPLLWNSSGTGTWNTNSVNIVWKDRLGASVAYSEALLPGDSVVFSDSNLVADTTVTLNTVVTPGGISITNDAYQYTISGSGGIAGSVSLIKAGTNTLTLGTANTFTGPTALNNGTLKLANASALPAGNTLTMAGKGTLDMNGNGTALTNITASTAANTIIDTSAGAGSTALSILNQTSTITATIKDGASKSVAVSLANNNGGTAAFALNTSNTFSGGLTLKHTAGGGTRLIVGSPVVTVGNPGNITSSPFGRGAITIGEATTDKAGIYMNASNATIANELVVNTTNGTDLIYALRVDGTGNNVSGKVTANADLTLGSYGTGTITLTNEIAGTGGVRLVTSATALTVNLFGPNSYSGKTTLREGTLAFNSIGNVGSGPSALGAPTTPAAGTITVGNGTKTGMTLLYRGMGHTTDRVIELAGTTGGLTIDHSGTNLLKFTSDLLMSGSGNKRFALTGANNSTGEVAGVISDNAGGKLNLYKDSNGSTWILSGANTFTDVVEINAGKLIVAHSSALGLGNKTVRLTNGSAGHCQLHLDGSVAPVVLETNITLWVSNTADPGTIYNVAGTNTIKGEIRIDSGGGGLTLYSLADKLISSGQIRPITTARAVNLRGNGDGEVSGNIVDGSTVNMPLTLDQGTGTWTLSGVNTYSGSNTVSSGTLVAGSDQAFGTNNVVNLAGGNLGGAIGTWSVTNTINVSKKADIVTAGTLILSGLVTNNAALNKTGAGTLLLNGSKTGTGAVTVSAGVLGGTGSIAGTVTNLATITAADTNTIGALTLQTNLVVAANSTIVWNCNAVTQDVIQVKGVLTLPATATVTVSEETIGDLGAAPRVLFTFASGPAPTLLTGWTVLGAPLGTVVRVDSDRVVLYRPGGTMISIF